MKQLTEVMGRTENRRAFLKNSMVAGAVANEARCGWSAGREDACPIEKNERRIPIAAGDGSLSHT
jgi:hypothetical protein